MGVMLDKHISELIMQKPLKIIYQTCWFTPLEIQFLIQDSLKTVYFSCIHSYLDYANIAWASTLATKLKRVYLKQKYAVRIVFNKDKLNHSKPLFENLNPLNIYQINLHQYLTFMQKFINNQILLIFSDLIKKSEIVRMFLFLFIYNKYYIATLCLLQMK